MRRVTLTLNVTDDELSRGRWSALGLVVAVVVGLVLGLALAGALSGCDGSPGHRVTLGILEALGRLWDLEAGA